ncbi:oxygenase MpaB family protein [Kineococcus sp. SYSU DK003]|uniref:oxygenase MpaB family protein n=1 Tax=Kineococcus sp. SYSU DK003 TaxID=3383124 RepID=UPI003D7DD2FD
MTSRPVPDDSTLRAAQHRGDPPADAVAEALAADPGVREQLEDALRNGSAVAGHPAVAAFVAELEELADAADEELLRTGARATFTTPLAVHVFDVGAGALLSSYRPPGPAAVLTGTGRLVHGAHVRLDSTARWLSAASLPGGLRRGAQGWRSTAWVRVGHAVVRRVAARPADGTLPISQFDSVRTWLDFTFVAPRSAHRLGHEVTDAEYAQFLEHWRLLGALLGVEPELIAGVVDRSGAAELHRRIDALTGPPSEDSRDLTRAGLQALAGGLADLTGIPHGVGLQLARAVGRRMQGPELADALGIAPTPLEHAVPVVAAVARGARAVLRRSPAAWEAMVRRNITANEEFLRRPSPG